MITFDPVALRARLLGDCGIQFYLRRSLEDFQADGALASGADAGIDEAIKCLLVGFDDAAHQLLKKARHWLDVAFAANEVPLQHVPDGTEAHRFHALAMCNWLLHGIHDIDSLKEFVKHEDRFLPLSGLGKNCVEVTLVSPHYLNAGAYEQILKLIAEAHGLGPPKDLSSIRSEGQMAYVLSRQHLNQDSWSEAQVQEALRRFMNRNMNEWLTGGHWDRAAEWLKIAYWREGGLSPKETLMKAYDHLPRS